VDGGGLRDRTPFASQHKFEKGEMGEGGGRLKPH